VSVLRPHIETPALRTWSLLLPACLRFASTWRARCEAIVDSMFGFELRREETDHLTRRVRKR
jgi:hypothetical protein